MKKAFILFTIAFYALALNAQDARLAGVWKYHHEATSDAAELSTWDDFIKIDIEDGEVFVALKLLGNNVNGHNFQTRNEVENIIVNLDGSLSFDKYYRKKAHESDNLYYTEWDHYTVKYKGGGRLNVSIIHNCQTYDKYNRLVGDYRGDNSNQYIYYNEKDNW